MDPDGLCTCAPAPDFYGTYAFQYRTEDAAGARSNLATVSLVTLIVNQAPVAADDSYSTPEDTTLTVAAPGLLANDTDVDVRDAQLAVRLVGFPGIEIEDEIGVPV